MGIRPAADVIALGSLLGLACMYAVAGCGTSPYADSATVGGGEGGEGGEGGDGGDGGESAGDACSSASATNLTITPRATHTALDETDVYFTRVVPPSDSAILRCGKCGCATPTELVGKLGQPGGIAVDDRYLFWTDMQAAGSLNRIEKSDPSKRQTLAPLESPIGVVVDGDFVYWTVIGGGPNGIATAGVYRAKKHDFSEIIRLATARTLPDDVVPHAIAVDDMHVYYTTAPDLVENSMDPCIGSFGTVRRVLKAGGPLQTSETIATGQACPVGLALSDDAIYWANLGADTRLAPFVGSVSTRKKAGGAEVRLANAQGRPTSIAFHAGRLTWSLTANQRVVSCMAPACTDVMALAIDQRSPAGVNADPSGIYWAVFGTASENFTDGALRRAAPP